MTEPRFQIGQLVSPIGYSPGVVRSLAWITASNPQQRDGWHYVVEGGATRRFMENSLRPVKMEEPVADSNDFTPAPIPVEDGYKPDSQHRIAF